MYLSKMRIENFRSIQSLDVNFSEGLNVIVGENNIGKSSIVDAIRLALGPSGATSNDSFWLNQDDFRHISFNQFEKKIRIDLFFANLSPEDMGLFVEALNHNKEDSSKSTISIHFEATWNDKSNRALIKRWGGDREKTKAAIDDEALHALRWTYLEPLRDAASALAPGRNSRIVKLLSAFKTDEDVKEIEELFSQANTKLVDKKIIKQAQKSLSNHLEQKLGKQLSPNTAIQASEYNFDKIIRTMRIVLRGPHTAIDEVSGDIKHEHFGLDTNGLGYNNLIFIAAVLAELGSSIDASHRLLLVEEPEAHLHPQLQTKLADYLSKLSVLSKSTLVSPSEDKPSESEDNKDKHPVQVIVTSHSPTITSHVRPDQLKIFHKTTDGKHKIGDISHCNIKPEQLAAIQRLLDVTKGAMCFARGVIFVEGVTEELLFPVLAKKLDINLDDYGVSVIPVHGVDFKTLLPFFGTSDFEVDIPVAIVTDRDPQKLMADESTWDGTASKRHEVIPQRDANNRIIPCDRIQLLEETISTKENVELFMSRVTLEYNLGYSQKNIKLMAEAWNKFYDGTPSFTVKKAEAIEDKNRTRSLYAWREICLSQATVKKSEFAHQLAYMISKGDEFDVPSYIKRAIEHACGIVQDA